jgi:hypothetical protein
MVPKDLEKCWVHYQHLTQLTPRGAKPTPRYQARIHRMSCDALHDEACRAACIKTKSSAGPGTAHQTELRSTPTEANAFPAFDDVSTFHGPKRGPGWTSGPTTPVSANHPDVLASPRCNSFTIPAANLPAGRVVHAARDFAPPAHASPAVRLARDREQAQAAAASEPTSQKIQINVDTGVLPANSIIWRQGAETDGASFNYHAFSGEKACA